MATSPSADIGNPRQPFEIVGPEIDEAQRRAEDSRIQANEFLERIADFAANFKINQTNVTLDPVSSVGPVFNTPTVPQDPNLAISLPALPADFVPANINDLDLSDLGAIPTFTETPPTINPIAQPNPLTDTFNKTAPVISTDFPFPDSPTIVLPDVPTFQSLSIPTSPTVTLPVFDQVLPTDDDVIVPGNTFAFVENPYSSTLLDAVVAELLDRISNGGTGLPVSVEQQIWDRARSREDAGAKRSREELLSTAANSGFSRPSGATLAALDELEQATQNKIADLSREVAIEQARLEQENLRFAIQNTISLEQVLIQNHNNVQERAFQVQRFTQEVAIDIFNAAVSRFNVRLQAFQAFAAAFESQVRAELSKIEIFKAEIDAQRLINDINQTDVNLYLGLLQGIQSQVDIFKAQVDAVSSQLQAEGLKIQNFKTEVDAFGSIVAAKRDEFAAFETATRAELAKSELFDSQVRAFVSRIQAYSESVGAKRAIVDVDIAREELRLRQHLSKLDTFSKTVDAEVSAFQAGVEVYRGQAQVFSAQSDAERARIETEIKLIDARIANARAAADIALANAQVNIANAENTNKLLLDALTSGAQVSAELASSALSGISIGASMQAQGTSNYSENHDFLE